MITAVVENVIGGYLRPRRSVRRIIDGGHGFDAVILMVLLAYLLREIFVLLIPDARSGDAGFDLGFHVVALIERFVSFLLLSAVVFAAGRFFGGTGSWRETNLAMAWYLLVTSVIAPLALPAVVHISNVVAEAGGGPLPRIEMPVGALAMFMVASGIMLWLFACYVAELHRFTRTWNVVAVILGVSAGLSFAVMALAPPT